MKLYLNINQFLKFSIKKKLEKKKKLKLSALYSCNLFDATLCIMFLFLLF